MSDKIENKVKTQQTSPFSGKGYQAALGMKIYKPGHRRRQLQDQELAW
jgi:hypothetical protein